MAEREKQKKVVTGKVTVKKKSLKERFFKNLVNEDAGSIGDYILDNVVIPGIMGTVHNIITGTADKIFGGTSSSPNRVNVKSSNVTYTPYNQMSNGTVKPVSNRYDFKKYVFDNRNDAENVKDQVIALIQGPYQKASVADFYDLIGQDTEFTDNKYGWSLVDIKGISVNYTNNGYVLNMPTPRPFI